MKLNKTGKITVLAICFAVGMLMAVQYKTASQPQDGSGERSRETAIDLGKLEEENEKLRKYVGELEGKLDLRKDVNPDDDSTLETLYGDIDKFKTLSGYKDMTGSGVRVTLSDTPQLQSDTAGNYTYEYQVAILEIIHALNATEAEAISVNGERYTSYTEIVPAGGHIEINDTSYGPPFEIVALGNQQDLENSLLLKGGVLWRLENQGRIDVKLSKEESLSVPKYDGIVDFVNSKAAEEKR